MSVVPVPSHPPRGCSPQLARVTTAVLLATTGVAAPASALVGRAADLADAHRGASQPQVEVDLSDAARRTALARLAASDEKTIKRPSGLMCGVSLVPPVACTPPVATARRTRYVARAPASSKIPSRSTSRSWRKMSANPFVSPATRLVAADWFTMNRPSRPIACRSLTPPMACAAVGRDAHAGTTLPAMPIALRRLRTKTSERVLLSPVTAGARPKANAVHMPLPLIFGATASAASSAPTNRPRRQV